MDGGRAPHGPPVRGLLQALLASALILALISGAYLLLGAVPWRHASNWLTLTGMIHLPILMVVGWSIADSERVDAGRREALAQAREAQWNLLRSQLSPHFLFNALTAFAELGRRDWPATERGLLSLAAVYRRLLDLSERSEAPLGEERALVEAFLGIEALRLGSRMTVA